MENLEKFLIKSPTGKSWERIGVKPHHGINVPLFSLHSEKSCGIGEFFDLIPIIDWCASLKLDFIQLLPVNNANFETDPSPYNAISSCALNFLHLSFHELPLLEKFPKLVEQLAEFRKYNQSQRVEYPAVLANKTTWMRSYYQDAGPELLQTPALKQYLKDNEWLPHYALFRILKEHLKNVSWRTWPEELRYPTKEKFQTLFEQYKDEIPYYVLGQYLCFTQLKKVKEYANSKGVYLMGDIPIMLSSESADSWLYPEYFDKHLAAGAPPDYYNEYGQNWGFPIFDWDAMRKDHFAWWKRRLSYSEQFFDIVRIDHVIGFFRIWAIPPDHHSKEGRFIPENEKEWEPQGRELLKMIVSSTTMLPIAEDLGTVPRIVRPILKEMGICSTKVIRWERDYDDHKGYLPYSSYNPVSITCVSTHDSETLTLWWKTWKEEAALFAKFKNWVYRPELTEQQREEILRDSNHTPSLFHGNLLQEYLALFPELIWPNPEDERINVPGTVSNKNWSYRFKPSVEAIVSHQGLFSKVKNIVSI